MTHILLIITIVLSLCNAILLSAISVDMRTKYLQACRDVISLLVKEMRGRFTNAGLSESATDKFTGVIAAYRFATYVAVGFSMLQACIILYILYK